MSSKNKKKIILLFQTLILLNSPPAVANSGIALKYITIPRPTTVTAEPADIAKTVTLTDESSVGDVVGDSDGLNVGSLVGASV